MNVLDKMQTNVIEPISGRVENMVLFLHGYGANKDDLISIGYDWAPALPNTVFLSPDAPEPCDQMPIGRQWFSLRAIDRDTLERERQIESVVPTLNAYIDFQLQQWGIAESRLVVVGFSQGAMMAMYTMPRRKHACAGVIGYSGMLIDGAGLQNQNTARMPILAIHGEADDVVRPENLQEVWEGFSAAGFEVETILRPGLGHGIDHFGLSRGAEFAREALGLS